MLVLAGCSSPGPGSVDAEGRALDLNACLRNEPACLKTGTVGVSADIFPADDAVMLIAPASISLPLERVADAKHLRWLALGMLALPLDPDPNHNNFGMKLAVTVDGAPTITYVVPAIKLLGWKRVELDMKGFEPPPGARVTITAVEGRFDLLYSAGRWGE